MGLFTKLKSSLEKTRGHLVERVSDLVAGAPTLGDEFYEELEEVLIKADVGVETALALSDKMREELRKGGYRKENALLAMEKVMAELLGEEISPLNLASSPPTVILVVGVNGVGKTTTIAKLAHRLKERGNLKVMVVAADTFRAAAIDQLEIWAQRVGVPLIRHQEGSDPAAVVFDALQAAQARKMDVVIIDTAGRLHTKGNLMEELKKVNRVLQRVIPQAPHETLLVLDANTGQNAVAQARQFMQDVAVTGLVLTKLDGTAKGGAILGIKEQLDLPVKFVGLGEGLDDLEPFSPKEFVAALFPREEV